jgi:hypothetical protein
VPQTANEQTIDPRLGSCKAFISVTSLMKEAGKRGADIGANVFYRCQKGTPNTQPPWGGATGKFPCAVVAGE